MANTIKKGALKQKINATDTLELHPHTDADVVSYSKTIAGVAVTDVKAALDKIVDSGTGVTSVTAGDNSITIGGTATAPTVAVKKDTSGNVTLSVTTNGLKANTTPAALGISMVKTAGSESITIGSGNTLNLVTRDTTQNITGSKTIKGVALNFSDSAGNNTGNITINGSDLEFTAGSGDAVIIGDNDVVLSGTNIYKDAKADANKILPIGSIYGNLIKADSATNTTLIDSDHKITLSLLPDVILGQLVYGGTVTGAGVATLSTNAQKKLGTTETTITLVNSAGTKTSVTGWIANEGIFYIASSDGSFADLGLKTGDWLISTGTAWKKIDNTDAVTGVKGNAESSYRIGNVNITPANIGVSLTTTAGSEAVTVGGSSLNVVTRNTTQTISGKKTFSAQPTFTNGIDFNVNEHNIVVNTDDDLVVSAGQDNLILTGANLYKGSVDNNNRLVTVADIPSVTGYVVGPDSATDNAIARYDGTTGKIIQNSNITIDDDGNETIYTDVNNNAKSIKFNNGSADYASIGASFYGASPTGTLKLNSSTGGITLEAKTGVLLKSGATAIPSYGAKFNTSGLTANHAYSFPNADGTLALQSSINGSYSAVTVTNGIVTAGAQVLEVIAHGATPTVATGGWYFERDDA